MTDLDATLSPTARGPETGDSLPRDLPLPEPLEPDASAVFLDFDGTLVEIADHPDDVVIAPDLPQLLANLSRRLDGRFAIVTGRSIAALEVLLGPIEVAVAGSHGGEFRRSAAAGIEPLAEPLPREIVSALEDFAAANGGLLVEPKPFSVAVHYRHHPDALEGLLTCAQGLASAARLSMKHGKQVIELAMPGSDKGTAAARFMALPEFAGKTPLFLGDDVTDEDAFHAMRRLGGQGVLVGPMRPTAAATRLPGVAAVHAWLKAGLEGNTHP
jgi:trehalose 6-phosphate phosphatase